MRILLAAALLAAPAPAPAFLDGFETPAVTGGSTRYAAGAQLGPWQVTAGDVDLSTTRLWSTAEGRQNLDLDGAVNGAVARTVTSTPLLTYRISYSLGGNYVGAPAVKTGELRVNGKVVQKLSFDTAGKSRDNMGYTRHTAYVPARSRSLRVEFASTTSPAGHGPLIDDVRVDSCLLILCPKARVYPA
ncbi:DUF642 domain-containing protein [Paractinoplanes brasiliensis]|uniref:Uncharacterized protein DUF642 n=1 Tax=Paractinoplanes brasiliensis TaxID=52695 RepID=A0A4R6JTX3_9ACTN|nr:DUF642 domain-containing protein [Actinoplanes brasiliensis]TDO40134.1 uncharacterized protein DUF642 [Actinoplanes brasiliensis]GID25200.1 hypothetical protein Abr02nite_01830 [Actinoplanes brasiliensis]